MAKSGWDWNLFRLAVIEAGIRGELTADWRAANPDVEPAHALLERIAEEKAELVRTKQIRKEKPLPPINPKEVPFDIPKSWEWTRFRDVFTTSSGGTPSRTRPEFWNGPVTWYKSGELTDSLEPLRDCSEETISELGLEKSSTKLYNEGTLLIAMYGATAGKLSILGRSAATNQAICGAVPLGDFNLKYGFRTLESFRDVILEDSWGMSQPNISQTYLQEFLVPVPPPEEQQEIVQILSALDSGESDGPVHPVVARIQMLEKEFRALAGEYESQEKWLADLRSALLQEATSGQLTADWRAANPDVEPAHMLLERIAEEKAELIRTKQIRKEKPLPPINPDEVPFDIPSSWEWSQLGALTTYGTSPKVESSEIESDTWVLDLEDIEKGSSRIIEKVRLKDRPFNSTKAQFKRGQVLYSKLRPYLDKVVVADEDGVCTTEILPLPVFCGFSPGYLLFSLKAPHFVEYATRSVSGMKMPRLGTEEGRGAVLPIAPPAEQQEIVRRLEMQLEKLDALQHELEQSKEAGQLLMKSKLGEVFKKKTPLVKSVLNG